MNTSSSRLALLLVMAGALVARAQDDGPPPAPKTFDGAAAAMRRRLDESVAELNELRERTTAEKLPLSRKLRDLEDELIEVRRRSRQTKRQLDGRALDLNNLRNEIKAREDEVAYLSGLLGDYIREFESRLHISESKRYGEVIEAAKLAPDNDKLSQQEIFEAQAALLGASLDRLHEALGGARFEGSAVDASGGNEVKEGTFVLVGPAAIFRSRDGRTVGTAEQRIGSLEPTVIAYPEPGQRDAAAELVTNGVGSFPLDPTLGNAHKIAAVSNETFIEHVEKGGPVMVPIFAMAGLALLIALYKWMTLSFVRKPSRARMTELLDAVAGRDHEAARAAAHAMKGPTGVMLAAGADHLAEPRELIEEVMYETVLTTKLRVNRLLPFIAICAASAPLLGLLGTVTGIINTFKMITVFGSGDVKSLSGGISEALITTKFGLIVAIPSLLLHAFLSRKARGVIGRMEAAAHRFVNEVSRSRSVVAVGGEAPHIDEHAAWAGDDITPADAKVDDAELRVTMPRRGAKEVRA